MPSIHDDQVALSIESRASQFSTSPFKRAARQAARIDDSWADGHIKAAGDSDQRLGTTAQVAL